jgi:hypothetical protein
MSVSVMDSLSHMVGTKFPRFEIFRTHKNTAKVVLLRQACGKSLEADFHERVLEKLYS